MNICSAIWPTKLATQTTQPVQSTYKETKRHMHVGPCCFLGKHACPRALVAKRVYVGIREKEGFKHPPFWRAPC
ncbi:hypothetical protein, partial [Burkholderia sp. S171]|uniref:hypothetical protein n=1 Tax=Burkholderia sp. S171 TaxID=1641860 RepID=UPI001C202CF2